MAQPYIEVFASEGSVPFLGVPFPSGQIPAGQPGSDLLAYLAGMRATFGFNSSPHTFELDFIPSGVGHGHGASGNLPAVDTALEMYVSGFYINGLVQHADWDSSSNGTMVNLSVKDRRITLDQYKITTDDFGEDIPSGVCSIPREFRLANGITKTQERSWSARGITKTEIESNDPLFLEYQRIIERGATYNQILNAIERVFGADVLAKLPTVDDLATNIGTDVTALRWKIGMQTLRSTVSKVTLDTAFDWYWNMAEDKVSLINKKTPFTLPESRILSIINGYGGSGIDNVTRIAYGHDKMSEPISIHMLGAHQEGFMNSPKLSPIDGLEVPYDGDPSGSGVLYFEAAWSNLTVGFYDANGFYKTYTPSEKELQCALAGIENWTYFKIYQTASTEDGGWGLPSDAGSVAAQHTDFESRLDPRQPLAEILNNPDKNIRFINNRRDMQSNWVIEFYNRVSQHANRHYGKSYVATNALVRDTHTYSLMNSAWANVENQREDPTQPFVDDYEINRDYGVVSPFFKPSDGRINPYCTFPSGTVYGPRGEDSPASFISWTEDAFPFNPSGDGTHYIPVQLSLVGGRTIDPRHDGKFSFEHYPEQTIWCQLPQMAGSGIEEDEVFGNLATLVAFGLSFESSGVVDLMDPRELVIPYTVLSGVAVPVQAAQRYGAGYPSVWSSGTPDDITGTKIIVDDGLAPWVEFPQGQETSVEVMERHANDKLHAELSIQEESQFVEVGQVGLPRLSFDTFANQTPSASGYVGEREHGVNSVSIYYGTGGLTTTYKAQSYYDTPRNPSPLSERTRARLHGVIQPIDFTDLGDFLARTGFGDPNIPLDPIGGGGADTLNFDFERQEAAEVTVVNNVFGEAECAKVLNGQTVAPEEQYYVGISRNVGFAYIETAVIFGEGVTYHGHTLNSLDVSILVNPDENTVDRNKILSTELDQHTVIVDNQTGDSFTGTLMVTNREGTIRPTRETIRNSDDNVATDDGVFCQDGYLNYGDACVYYHKRIGGEEFAYVTGGRKLGGGQIVTVEEADGGLYNVSILGDPHSRWICGIPSLNDVSINVTSQAQLAEWGTTQIKPGPGATGFTLLNTGTGGGSIPGVITNITDPGTSGATCTVTELGASGLPTGATYSGVYVVPYAQFAEIGDAGLMSVSSTQSAYKYIQISKQTFLKY